MAETYTYATPYGVEKIVGDNPGGYSTDADGTIVYPSARYLSDPEFLDSSKLMHVGVEGLPPLDRSSITPEQYERAKRAAEAEHGHDIRSERRAKRIWELLAKEQSEARAAKKAAQQKSKPKAAPARAGSAPPPPPKKKPTVPKRNTKTLKQLMQAKPRPAPEPEEELEEEIEMPAPADLSALFQIPELGDTPTKPSWQVSFDYGYLGRQTHRYHWIIFDQTKVCLVFDGRFEYSSVFVPPEMSADQLVQLEVCKAGSPGEQGEDYTIYRCACAPLHITLGTFEIVVLFRDPSDIPEPEEQETYDDQNR